MEEKVFQILDKFVKKDDVLIVGVSGGVDSVVLLDILVKFVKKTPLKLVIAHVNHGLRGKESDADEELVKWYAKKFGLQFEFKKLDLDSLQKKNCVPNLEAKCREKRYEFFGKLLRKYKAKYVVTAHHLNDNLETVLLNFVRGAGLNGLTGMNICGNDIFRPFLHINKKEILKYATENDLKFYNDYTNFDEKYARNRLRLKVIPELKKINPNLEKSFWENLENLREIKDLIERQIPLAVFVKGEIKFNIVEFRALHLALQKAFLIDLYKKAHGSTYYFTSKHMEQILKVLNSGKGNVKKEFGPGQMILVEGKTGIVRDN
ncbi:tRNA lysidine(34) synthetase TilS [Candidatus Peregrinibacteria bacterium RIFOXYB2_FULL_32_7]|nr:MAG: tRNA lysidine(34) synthetase TilS [Candidatus Peregrinibacteria bacterium RIFOXYB2_FULL_32_7]